MEKLTELIEVHSKLEAEKSSQLAYLATSLRELLIRIVAVEARLSRIEGVVLNRP